MINRLLVSLILFFTLFIPAWAATDDFNVNLFINSDITPPTTPGPLIATSVTYDQVDLSWGASTDNYLLGGYQVFRDAVQIATTTMTIYSDTGVTPSTTATTTYQYYVRAFDAVLNFSSSSNILSTTTPLAPIPATTTPVDNSSNAGVLIELEDIKITPYTNSASVVWSTNRVSSYELRWGETYSYELGFVTSGAFQKNHATLITDLTPNTTYVYELVGFDRQGVRSILSIGEFTTKSLPDTTSPANVSRFVATNQNDRDVLLTWQNPVTDFDYVRIVRNPLIYPSDPNNGFVVYEGKAESFTDSNVLSVHPIVYYTAFVFDPSGNRSSGAITFAKRFAYVPGSDQFIPPVTETDKESTPTTTAGFNLTLDDVIIIQDDEIIFGIDGSYIVDTNEPFIIQAPFNLFPRHLKTIQVTLYHPVDRELSYSYLLRANSDRTAYEAKISNLGFSGTIPMLLSVYDYRTTEYESAEGEIISKQTEPVVQMIENVVVDYGQFWWIALLLLLLLLIWFLLMRRRRRNEDNQLYG